jgi:hypothetical protein
MEHYFKLISRRGDKRKNFNAVLEVEYTPQYNPTNAKTRLKYIYERNLGWIWCAGLDGPRPYTYAGDKRLDKALNKLFKGEPEATATI